MAEEPRRPVFDPEQEVRFAVVMYGGVSLAIYINGVVQELFHLVRATAPAEPFPEGGVQEAYFRDDELTATEVVYRELGKTLGFGEPDGTIRTRFIVDILSGSSAGGINAIYLAKALANQQEIDRLRDLWIREGDIGMLLNDRRSYDGLPKTLPRPKRPPSLLNGYRLYDQALKALTAMWPHTELPEDAERPSYAEQVDLAVTTTDLQGLLLPVRLFDRVVYEARHKNVFRFVYATETATGDGRNDFTRENDELLAFAARATASFPFAFEPVVLADVRHVAPGAGETGRRGWRRFFRDYVSREADYWRYAFADGGYLDNKPFTHATDALRKRRADVPVDRKLIYIEPHPALDPVDDRAAAPEPRPDVIDNVGAALVGLPRTETIREDIEAVLDLNRSIDRVRELVFSLEEQILAAPRDAALSPLASDVYRALRQHLLAGDLASLVVRISGIDEESDAVHAARLIARAWLDARRNVLPASDPLDQLDLAFRLRRLSFLQDRINELYRADERATAVLAATPGPGASPAPAAALDELRLLRPRLRALKVVLNDVFVALRRSGRITRSRPDPSAERAATLPADVAAVRDAVEALGVDERSLVQGVLRAPGSDRALADREAMDRARAFVEERRDAMRTLDTALTALLEPLFAEAEAVTLAALTGADLPADPTYVSFSPAASEGARDLPAWVRGPLLLYYERYEMFDALLVPLAFPDLGERNPVEIIRISPVDATSLVRETAEQHKLAGIAVHHFGGFFAESWRRNDMLWGRLDGAERIIAALVPDDTELREALCLRAHAGILREELLEDDAGELTEAMFGALAASQADVGDLVERAASGDTPGRAVVRAAVAALGDREIVEHFRQSFRIPPGPDRPTVLSVGGRAMHVAGRVLEQTSEERRAPAQPWFWLARLGRAAWGLAELAWPRRPHTLAATFARYWLQIALLLGLTLILFGLLGIEAAQQVGWTLIAFVLAFRVVLWLVEAALAGRRFLVYGAAAAATALIVLLAVVEVARHWREDLEWIVPGTESSGIEEDARQAVGWLDDRFWPWDDGG